jgi:hypothetical protein
VLKSRWKTKADPPHKFTDLCHEFIWLKSLHEDESPIFLLDAIILIVSRHQQGCVIATYRTDNKEAAAQVKKIRCSVAAWFYGYWQNVMGYRLAMVQKLMESFDINTALYLPASLNLIL